MTVDYRTGEITDSMTADEAARLTLRIRLSLGTMLDARDKVLGLIHEARTGRADEALGFRSWTEYVSNEFADALPRLTADERREFVTELASTGMSTRAIAPIVGMSQSTASRMARESDDSPQTPQDGDGSLSEATGRATQSQQNAELPRPAVIGLDGKTYSRPAPLDHAARADQAIAEFPDLAYYRDEVRDLEHCWRLADTLRSFAEPELTDRISTLRRSIEIDRRKRNGTYVSPLPEAHTCPTCGQTVKDFS